ncbi:hypothetical protein [Blastochloris tepida]|uniref:Uncharacterized protein n=1 Tax=Blastochloris tepida TaxID=2233851 RepID=A0A348FWR7_9HYPH|nr:hypothetical protein [Blastochloris tepida]BBF91750.1 hypothetical protein BLTE_04350 [Blastochloris tepida]
MYKDGWGAILGGKQSDIEDWALCLGNGFDPCVERVQNDFILRSSTFDSIDNAEDLKTKAAALIDTLNGALSLDQNSGRVEFGGAAAFRDGNVNRTIFAEIHEGLRVKARATATVIDRDGNFVTQKPQPSTVQNWISKIHKDELLEDALIFFGRASDWFDLYKSLECLIRRFGSEQAFFEWAGPESQARLLKQTANWHRHAPKKNERPVRPLSFDQARGALGFLLNRALNETSSNK